MAWHEERCRRGAVLVMGGLAVMACIRTARAQCLVQRLDIQVEGFQPAVSTCGDEVLLSGGFLCEKRGEGWIQTASLRAPGVPLDQEFGVDVALDGDVAAVSTEWGGGGVHVFERTAGQWTHVARLSPTTSSSAYLWIAIALSGDVLAVGDPTDDTWGEYAGLLHVYERVGGQWRHTAGLRGPVVDFASFGAAIDVEGSTILAGTRASGGAVLVFERTPARWQRTATIEQSDGYNEFGHSLAISSDRALIGQYPAAGEPTRAFLYRRHGADWVLETTLVPSSHTVDFFGTFSLDLERGRAIVAASGVGGIGGCAVVFEEIGDRWHEIASLFPVHDPNLWWFFPGAVSISGETLVANDHAYAAIHCANATRYCAPTGNSYDIARIEHGGSLSVAANSFELRVTGCPDDEVGFFFYGSRPTEVPFGAGNLCVSPGPAGYFRFGAQPTDSSILRRAIDFTAPPADAGAFRIAAGATWYFQFAFRDGTQIDFTEGLRVLFGP